MLVLVLALLAVAGLVAAGTATRSLAATADAAAAEADLRDRWAVASLRTAVLGRGEELLRAAAAREPGRWPEPRTVRGAVLLAGTEYRLTLADESAKANVNAVHRAGGTAAVGRAVRAAAGPGSPPVRPRPLPGAGPDVPAYDSPGQLFALGNANAAAVRAATADLTVADVPLNLRRAPDAAVRVLAGGVAGGPAAAALVAARGEGPGSAAELLARAGLRESQLADLRGAVGDRSGAWSLWAEPVGRDRGTGGGRAGRATWLLRIRVGGRDYYDAFAW